jgi:multiple sugar transport system substrate-binding protein
MFGATNAGSNSFFNDDGTSTFTDPGWTGGIKFLVDLYQDGLAPKDSVNWGFNEIVAGFYSSTCAMLDQDPDALIAIAERMSADDFAVAPMPKGPDGKSFPTIGYAGWAMFSDSEHKEEAWKLIDALVKPESDITWNKRVGALPIYKSAENDPFYAGPQFKGWFEELADADVQPTVMPTYLEEFAFFKDALVPRTSQEALLGQRTPEDLAQEWADYLTKAQQKFLSSQKQ